MATLILDGIRLSVGATPLIQHLDLAITPGTVATVMGPSGSGKSSLLALVAGLLPPAFTAVGHVRLGPEDLTPLAAHRRRLGLLYQDDLLFPHLSIADNLAFGLDPSIRGAARKRAVEEALIAAELKGLGGRDPATLSGGQRARAALFRTLLARPRALLLDEPFSRLDQDLRGRMRRLVFDQAAAHGLPVLLVSHDPADAEAAAGPVVELQALR
jgi:putative thiamine transport system ATP-binding protein